MSQPGAAPSTSGVPLALQFEVEEPPPHFSYTGRRDPVRGVRQLKVRPVIMGAKGKWIRGDVSWNTLSYLNFRRESNQAHVEWMQEFLAGHSASASRMHNSSGLWLGLNSYAGKNLWSLLSEARKIGLALVHSRATEPVRVAEAPAAVGLSLSRYGAPAGGPSAADPGGSETASEGVRPAPQGPAPQGPAPRCPTPGWSFRPPSPWRGKRLIRPRWARSAGPHTASSSRPGKPLCRASRIRTAPLRWHRWRTG